jgi:hypothetical protein
MSIYYSRLDAMSVCRVPVSLERGSPAIMSPAWRRRALARTRRTHGATVLEESPRHMKLWWRRHVLRGYGWTWKEMRAVHGAILPAASELVCMSRCVWTMQHGRRRIRGLGFENKLRRWAADAAANWREFVAAVICTKGTPANLIEFSKAPGLRLQRPGAPSRSRAAAFG